MKEITYKATASQSTYKGNKQFYPVIKFYSRAVNDSYYLNEPQPTKSKAVTIAKNYIKNLN